MKSLQMQVEFGQKKSNEECCKQRGKSNSLFCSSQSLLNKKFFLVGQKKLKTSKNKTYTKVLKTFRIM